MAAASAQYHPTVAAASAALAVPNGRGHSYTMSSAGAAACGPRPLLRDALGIESYSGLGGLRGPTLNGAILVFGRGSRFLWNCLDEFAG